MTEDKKGGPKETFAHQYAMAGVEAFGKMSREEQRQFEADLVAMVKAEGLLLARSGPVETTD